MEPQLETIRGPRQSPQPEPATIAHEEAPAGNIWRLLVLFWLAATLVCPSSFSSGRAQASAARLASSIAIVSQTQTFTYPSQIIFQLQATDSVSAITSARLEISVPQEGIDRQITVPVSQPGAQVSLTYTYNATHDYLPPFTPITYHWTLGDSAHNSLTGSDQRFDFVDTRFHWQHVTQHGISVYWYNQSASFGQNILNTAVSEATTIEHDLNGTLTAPLRVLVYASNQDLHGGLPPGAPDWAGGVAFVELQEALIVVGNPATHPLDRDLPHELTHLIFHEIAGLDCGGCPLWFDEGLAVYHQRYHEAAMQARFKQAVQTNTLLALNTLTSRFPQSSDQAELAYAESWNFVTYLYTQYGQPKVARLVDRLDNTAFDTAFPQIFGADISQVESQWHVSLGLPPTVNATPSAPAASTPASSQTPTAGPSSGNSNQTIIAIAAGVFLLVLLGLTAGTILQWRRRQAPTSGFGAQAPAVGGPPPPQPLPPGGQNGFPPGGASAAQTSASAVFSSAPALSAYEQHARQRQQLLQALSNLLAQEKRLDAQQVQLERQMAHIARQEQAALADQRADLAWQAAQQKRLCDYQLALIRQQRERLSQQKRQWIQMERQLSAQSEALPHPRVPHAPNSQIPSAAWPQPPAAQQAPQE